MSNLFTLPENLPVPKDDGAADHLTGMALPDVALPSTDGGHVRLGALMGRSVLFAYPRTGRPGEVFFAGWDAIPGARGCTPEACGFRDHLGAFRDLGVAVYGLSTQSTAYQSEAAGRLNLSYTLLSDHELTLTSVLRLPTFEVNGETLLKRLTLVLDNARIEHAFYPVFPPDRHAEAVLDWLGSADR